MNGQIVINSNTNEALKNYEHKPLGNIRFTSIILLTYNKLEYTKLCIDSIRKFTPKGQYEIIVVDNNSTDGTVDYLKSQDDLKVIYNDYNAGFPKGCNQGIEISKGESILLLNNDTIVTPYWLNNLDNALYSNSDIGAVGAISNSISNMQKIDVTYNNIEEMLDFATSINNQDFNGNHELRQKLVGYCFLVKRSVLDKIGLLDEIFTPGNFEDDDLSFRILLEGYKLLLCKNVFIHHFGSISFKEFSEGYLNLLNINLKKFSYKWGFDSSYSTIIRSDILGLIDKKHDESFNVLDVGCGTGATLLHIKNLYNNANLFGIEVNKSSAKIAKIFANVLDVNIENIELPYERNFFDYIILGDVLEHLKDPWKVLKLLSKYLKDTGIILASIPNIMHISVINEIINGHFSYKDTGILDRTHLRFFTLNEIAKLFASANLIIDEFYSTPNYNLNENEQILLEKICSITNETLRAQYLSSQYIVKSSKL